MSRANGMVTSDPRGVLKIHSNPERPPQSSEEEEEESEESDSRVRKRLAIKMRERKRPPARKPTQASTSRGFSKVK